MTKTTNVEVRQLHNKNAQLVKKLCETRRRLHDYALLYHCQCSFYNQIKQLYFVQLANETRAR